MRGKTEIYLSGLATSDTYTYGTKALVLEYAQALVGLECLSSESGVRYAVRGYLKGGFTPFAMASGTLTSGDFTILHSGLTLAEEIQVGAENETPGESGIVTIYLTRRAIAT